MKWRVNLYTRTRHGVADVAEMQGRRLRRPGLAVWLAGALVVSACGPTKSAVTDDDISSVVTTDATIGDAQLDDDADMDTPDTSSVDAQLDTQAADVPDAPDTSADVPDAPDVAVKDAAAPDATPDATDDAGVDAAADGGADVGADAGVDAGPDVDFTKPGAPGTATVSAGGEMASQKYKMVLTWGQRSPVQGRASSAKSTLFGGLLGATGP